MTDYQAIVCRCEEDSGPLPIVIGQHTKIAWATRMMSVEDSFDVVYLGVCGARLGRILASSEI